MVVHDIKGENWALTAGWRRQELGSACLKFDPTADDGSSARYNPLLEVRPWPDDVKDAQNIADLLIDPAGAGGHDHWDLHWNLTAHDLLVGVILHVLYAERDKTFRGCLTFLADPTRPIENALSSMLTTAHDPAGRLGWMDPGTGQPTRTHPVVAGAARALLNKSDNERSSVVSSAVKFLNLYRDPIVAANTETCDFALTDLLGADRPVSLYLTTPPSDIIRTRPLLRLLLNQLGRRLTETLDAGGMSGSPRPPRLLLMLDEFPALGRLDFLQTALAYLPGLRHHRVPDRPGPRPARPDVRPRRIDRLELPRPRRLRGEQGRDRQGDLGDGRRDDRAPGDTHVHREPTEPRADARDGVRAGVSAPAPDSGRGHAPARRRGPDLRGGPAAHLRPAHPLLRGSRLRGPGGDSRPRPCRIASRTSGTPGTRRTRRAKPSSRDHRGTPLARTGCRRSASVAESSTAAARLAVAGPLSAHGASRRTG